MSATRSFFSSIEGKPVAVVVGDNGPFFRSLLSSLAALDMQVISLDPEMEPMQSPICDVCICILSKNDEKVREQAVTDLLQTIKSANPDCTSILLLFDASLEDVKSSNVFDKIVSYSGVIEPSLPSLSWTFDSIVKNALVEKPTKTDGVFYPLWYEDCARHAVSIIFNSKKNQTFAGATAYRVQDFSHVIESELQGVSMKNTLVPIGKNEKDSVEGRDLGLIIELLEGMGFFRTLQAKKTAAVSQLHPRETEKKEKSNVVVSIENIKKRKGRLHSLQKTIFMCCVSLLTVVGGAFGLTRYIQNDFAHRVEWLLNSVGERNTTSTVLSSEVTMLQMISKRAPLLLDGKTNITTLSQILTYEKISVEVHNALNSLFRYVFAGQGSFSTKDVSDLSKRLALQGGEAQALQSQLELTQTQLPLLDGLLASFDKSLPLLQVFLDEAPSLFGFDHSITYALVLTDPELPRASGGKIRAVTFATFEKGRLILLDDEKIASSSSGLVGEFEQTPEEKTFFSVQKKSLSGELLVLNQASMSAQLKTLIQLRTGRSVEGIINLSSQAVPQLLEAIGPVQIGTTTYTSSNADSKLHDLFLLQEQGRDDGQIGRFWNSFLTKTTSLLGQGNTDIISTIWTDIQRKQLVVVIPALSPLKPIVGALQMPTSQMPICPTQFRLQNGCTLLTLQQNENAIDGVLVGDSIQRSVSQDITLADGQILEKRDVSYRNVSASSQWPSGTYTAIVTFLLEPNATIDQIHRDSEVLKAKDVLHLRVEERDLFGVFIAVPPGQESFISLKYTLPQRVQAHQGIVYVEQKQLGIKPYGFSLHFYPPSSFVPTLVAPRPESTEKGIAFQTRVDSTKLFAIGL